ncbi:MAG: type II toxin-antitoxin system RelE/ParE family toxin [Bacteroidetes bacterium]|nr:type II toxin-antitoxin system RelE/ParE family toxin [Bacteroidota bacterium]
MVKVVWTGFALHDLDDIGEYIAKDSERYAKVVIQNLFESTDLS